MRLYQLFAGIFEYPDPSLLSKVNEAIAILISLDGLGASLLKGFRDFVQRTPIRSMQAIHRRTFDVESACYPYVGYHLYGDGNHRWIFLSGLKEHYRVCGFSTANEMPDHLGTMLRFLAKNNDEEEKDELISLCFIPALERMLEMFRGHGNPYRAVLEALLLLLRGGQGARDRGMSRDFVKEEFLYGR